MGFHRTDIPVRLKYLRQIFSDFFPTNDSYYWQATLLKRAAFFKCHDNPAEKNALRKELLVCCMQVKYIRGVILSLCYCQAFKLCFNFYSNNVTRGTK